MKIKNIILVLKDQMPLKRFFRNFFITRNAWGLFYKSSHVTQSTGKLKIKYNTKKSAERASVAMAKKYDNFYSNYKCLYCDGYHVGKTKK